MTISANSSDIADWNHEREKRKIKMTPKFEGEIMVFANDFGVEPFSSANATMLVSDINKIILEGGGLIEEGRDLNLTVKVFDSQGF